MLCRVYDKQFHGRRKDIKRVQLKYSQNTVFRSCGAFEEVHKDGCDFKGGVG